ncbi:MAG: hypothetical protein HUJ92_06205 [Bacteroidales bacterium]|nr:hypothetical protein [Bacteroidales bacterium]
MKKLAIIAFAFMAILFTSCEKQQSGMDFYFGASVSTRVLGGHSDAEMFQIGADAGFKIGEKRTFQGSETECYKQASDWLNNTVKQVKQTISNNLYEGETYTAKVTKGNSDLVVGMVVISGTKAIN